MYKKNFKRLLGLLLTLLIISTFSLAVPTKLQAEEQSADPVTQEIDSKYLTRLENGIINAVEYGADPTGQQDSTEQLQAAIDDATKKSKMLHLPGGTYLISKPLKVTTFTHIVGEGGRLTTIKKTTNDVDPRSQKDAIIVAEDAARGLVYHLTIEGLFLTATTAENVEYALYIPSSTRLVLKDIVISKANNGFYTNNTWLGVLESVLVMNAKVGFNFEPKVDRMDTLSGTSITATRLWAANCEIGYNLSHLQYSTLNSCACDNSKEIAYRFKHSRGITMNSCGAEDNYGETIKSLGETSLTINSMSALKHYGREEEGRGVLVFDDYSKVIINASQFARFYPGSGDKREPKNSYNVILGPDADITVIDTYLPKGGNTYINFTDYNSIKYIDGEGIRTVSGKGIERGSTILNANKFNAAAPIDKYPYEQFCVMKYDNPNLNFPGGVGIVETYYMTTDEGYGYNRQLAYKSKSDDVYVRYSLANSKPKWESQKAYNIGDMIMPDGNSTGHYYECITAGTSGDVEPVFTQDSGATITDGTVVWKEKGSFWSEWKKTSEYKTDKSDNDKVNNWKELLDEINKLKDALIKNGITLE